MMEEIRSLGFTHAEISHGLPFSKWPGVKDAVAQGVVKVASLHNFCPHPVEFLTSSPNYCQFSDERLSQREAAVRHTLVTIENAVALGARAVVLHLGWAGPRDISSKLRAQVRKGTWLQRAYVREKIQAVRFRQQVGAPVMRRVKECLQKIVEAARQHHVQLGFEIRESFDEFPNEPEMEELLKDYPPEVVGYWHDFGHAACKEFLTWHTHAETLERRKSRLIGCHIHDCAAPDRDHLALGRGDIDFPALLRHLPMDYLPVLEMRPEVKPEDILESKRLWDSYVNT
jgi:sugar phosphate isomerase/epimerase